ncbi:molybdopterin molybdotransferase MoeA [Persicimonas caeni]|uniref:Molybdopterin molybdenumtransferase n=1 Tax=Persicimonas caeni TaxID=2292766 RepID=A0A4Y6PQ91_PERCE|nr:molybdopterin molybdotransferase MoeA [Persicimonas caeni]QDG50177.1 molybdopterin molybdotransferase MoeA [Persicimonas caeni]QED31398.1 molybdopterin molybdotransferase MoeA [Persicimonas caeni]
MIDVDEALSLFAEHIDPLESERLAVTHALGRVSATEARAKIALPPFAQSAMDGYAVRAEDLAEASDKEPVELRQVGEVAAGDTGRLPRVNKGTTVRVFTGGRIPPGADAVVRQELVTADKSRISFEAPVREGKDLREVGEALAKDTVLVEPGERLDERHIAALAMCGHAEIDVIRQPAITLLVSGDEVISPGIELRPGEIYDANTPLLSSWLGMRRYRNIEIVQLEDDRRTVEKALRKALDQSDLVVSTGGVSVGDYDFFTDAADTLGLETIFWKVRQRPGKPLLFAKGEQTIFLGIPGNPGAVFISAYVYLRRVLDLLEGTSEPGPAMHRGVLAGPVGRSAKRVSWTGANIRYGEDGKVHLEPISGHRLSQVYRADAIVRVPAREGEMEEGDVVEWLAIK